MKLAEALSIRKDLQKKIDQLKTRLVQNVKIQEGDEPAEHPDELLKELDDCLIQLQKLILQINITNIQTQHNGRTLTDMIAERDVLTKRISILRDMFEQASQGMDRYSRSEIKYVTTINVKDLNKEIDLYAKKLRKLDMQIQAANFEVDLI
ncbi:DIP1984 family protein [Hoylesella timonensis]